MLNVSITNQKKNGQSLTHQITEKSDNTHDPDERREDVIGDETLIVSQDIKVTVLTLVTPIQTICRPITNVLPGNVPENLDEI